MTRNRNQTLNYCQINFCFGYQRFSLCLPIYPERRTGFTYTNGDRSVVVQPTSITNRSLVCGTTDATNPRHYSLVSFGIKQVHSSVVSHVPTFNGISLGPCFMKLLFRCLMPLD